MRTDPIGMVGWREFSSIRTELLAEFDDIRRKTRSRPVRVEHGLAGEAAVRKWLSNFLPRRFAVSSGYIIPELLETADTKLRHYDVIVYDALQAPILWVEGHADLSDQGKRRAIPAKYVHAVIEVKSSFGRKEAEDGVNKLREISVIAGHLPASFFSQLLFFDLNAEPCTSSDLLPLLAGPAPHGFCGGLILRCGLNADQVGRMEYTAHQNGIMQTESDVSLPLVRDVAKLAIVIDEKGTVSISERGAAIEAVAWNGRWLYSKQYVSLVTNDAAIVTLSWSINQFANFAMDILHLLDGGKSSTQRYWFGQVFDFCSASRQPNDGCCVSIRK